MDRGKGKGSSLLSDGLRRRAPESGSSKQGDQPAYDVLRGGTEKNSRRSHHDFLTEGPQVIAAEPWGISELNITRESLEVAQGDSPRSSLHAQLYSNDGVDNTGRQAGEGSNRGGDRVISRKDELKKKFKTSSDLREHAFQMSANEVEARQYDNPNFTDDDRLVGGYVEYIEPQVRDAVLDLSRKGYRTQSSGFSSDTRMQQIDGPFLLDKKTKNKLKSIGVEVGENTDEYAFMRRDQGGIYENYTVIRFRSDKSTLRSIQKEWKQITDLIPPLAE